MSFFRRLAKARVTIAVISGIVTAIAVPFFRWLTNKGAKPGVKIVDAEGVEVKKQD
ncbi:MAG: hypothetical protein WC802_01240 [Patescibacteria group bacterium]|jgi:hypothetical protein